jgi:uncharacterized protein (TIGR03083 family)
MVDAQDIEGLNPYDIMSTETTRLDRHFQTLSGDDWSQPTRCAGWSVRDVLAHLAASEAYNRACLEGTVPQFLGEIGAKGATDLATANDIGIREYDGKSTDEILDEWRGTVAANREALRARDGGDIETSVGAYPARFQAFHLAFELATHGDDIGVPVSEEERASRIEWQARFGRFALKETKPDIAIDGEGGRVHVRTGDVDVDLSNEEFVQAVAARVPSGELDDKTASALSATP